MKSFKKRLAVILCICMIAGNIPVSYALAEEKREFIYSRNNVSASPSDSTEAEEKEDEDDDWTEGDGDLIDDLVVSSKASSSNATPSNAELEIEKVYDLLDHEQPLFENETYYIESEGHLQWIQKQVNSGADDMQGKYLVLLEDIELQDEWIPIGIDSTHPFKGNFDGNYNTISNVTIQTLPDKNVGFFGYVEADKECTISNLVLEQIDIRVGNMEIAGGMIANLSGNKTAKIQIDNCEISGEVKTSGTNSNRVMGGMIGVLDLNDDSNIIIKKCTMQVNVESVANGFIGDNALAGGMIGRADLSGSAKVQIRRCQSTGEIMADSDMHSFAGGLIGKAAASEAGTFLLLSQSGFRGDVNAQSTYGYCEANVGGIIGVNEVSVEMRECFNEGNVFCKSRTTHTGGVIGLVNFDQTQTMTMENILVNSDIISQCTNGSSVCGGVIGATTGGQLKNAVIENAYVKGTMDAQNKAAIINWYSGNKETVVRNSYFAYEDLGINRDHVACKLGSFTTTWFTDSVENSYGLTSTEQQEPDSYIGWDLKRIWDVESGIPSLRFLDYWMIPGYEEAIYPKEINDEYCKLIIEFNDIVEVDLGCIELYNYNTDELIERIYTEDCEVKNGSTLEIPSYQLPFDEKIYVLADEGSIILGGKPFEGLREKDDWVFYTRANWARLTLKVIDESGKPVDEAKVYAQHQLFVADEDGIAHVLIQDLSQESLNDFLLVDAPGYIRQSKRIGDLGLDTYGNAFAIVTLYPDKDPTSPIIRYVSLYEEGATYGCDIGQVIKEYTTLPGPLSTIFAFVDWRGNTPGRVYMEQYYVKDGEIGRKELDLEENSHISVSIGEYFEKTAGEDGKRDAPIYLVAESASGKKSPRYHTNLKVVEGISFSGPHSIGFSLGQNFSLKLPSSLPVVGGGDIGFNYPGVPITMEMKGNKLKVLIAPKKTEEGSDEEEDKTLLEIIQNATKWNEYKEAKEKFKTRKEIAETFLEGRPFLGLLSDGFGWKTKTNVMGYIEAVADTNRSWTPVEGGISGSMDVAYNATMHLIMLGPIPIYGNLGGGVQGTMEVGMKDTPFTSMRDLDTFKNFEINPHATLGLGVGLPSYMNGEVSGNADIPIKFGTDEIITEIPKPGQGFPKLADNIKVSLEANLKAKVTALIFSWEKKLWGYTLVLYENANLQTADDVSKPASYQLMGRQYATRATSWNPSRQSLVKTNVYPYASPKLMPLEDGQILMWLDDGRERSSVNRTKLMYSICSRDGKWSEPKAVCDDGTADFAFDLLVKDGKVFVVWQNIKSVLPEDTTLTEMAKELEISVAVMEPSTGQFTDQKRLSSSVGIKAIPMLMNDGQGVQAVWTECSSDNYLLMDGTNYLKTSTYSDGVWQQEKTVFETEHTIVQVETDKNSHSPRAAFIVDMNRNLAGGEGYELFLLQQGGVVRLSFNDVMDANPCFSEFEGESALFTYSGGNIAYRKESSWDTENVMTGPEDPKVGSEFQVYRNEDGLLVMHIADNGKGDGQELQALIYDKDSGRWGKPVQITECEGSVYDFAGYQDGNGQYHIVNMQMNEDTEIADMEVQMIRAYTDIGIIGEPMFFQSDVKPESDIPIMVKISNQGLKKVTSVTMDVEGEADIFTTTENSVLLPGEENIIEGIFRFEDNIVRQDLGVHLQVPEDANPYNNESWVEIGLPDVSVDRVELLRDGDDYMVLAYIQNATPERIDDVSVDLKLLSPDGKSISDKKTVDLVVQGTKVISLPMKKTVLQQTNRKIVPLYVTVESDIEEAVDSNNRYWITVDNPYVDSEDMEETKHLDLDWIYYEMKPGERFTLNAEVYPEAVSGSSIIWRSSMPEIAEVSSDGVVTAKKPGKASIIATAFDGELTKVCEVNVVQEAEQGDSASQNVKLNVKEVLLTQKGQEYDLDYSIIPETDETQSVVWKSSNKAVAIVTQDGKITAIGEGVAQISVILMNGKTDICVVTVKTESEGGDDVNKPIDPDKEPDKPKDPDKKPSYQDPNKPTDPDNKPSGEESGKPGNSNHGSSGGGSSRSKGGSVGNLVGDGQWMKNETGWWYQYKDGTYPMKTWAFLPYMNQNQWYYFDEKGYMLSGWQFIDEEWYYLNPDGAMAVGWIVDNNRKYYLNPLSDGKKGRMLIGWQFIDGKWYYFNERSDGTKGALLTDTWVSTYYVNVEGVWDERKNNTH